MKTLLHAIAILCGMAAFLGGVPARADLVPVYHYNASSGGDDFYTADWDELGTGAYGYDLVNPSDPTSWYDGSGTLLSYASDSGDGTGKIPVYSYLNSGRHFYTTNYSRLGSGSGGWSYEQVRFYAWDGQYNYTYRFAFYRFVYSGDGRFFQSWDYYQNQNGWSRDVYGGSALDSYMYYPDAIYSGSDWPAPSYSEP